MKIKLVLAAFTAAALGGSAPAAADESVTVRSFVYEGNDDYYRENPLTSPAQFYNPIIPGWHSDPSVVRVGDDYWLVVSTFGYYPGVPLFHSRDLVNWEMTRNVLDRPSQLPYLKGQSLGKGGIYAPHISYNPANKLFYMVTTDVGRKNGHFYVTTADPASDWSDPVWLDGIDGIDPSFFFDDNGKSYIVYKEDTTGKPKWSNFRSIRFIEFDSDKGNTVGESWTFDEAGVGPEEKLDRDEGPHIYKINGRYYLICAEGGTGSQHSAVIYRSDDVRGPWTRWSRNPMLTQRHLKDNRTNPVTCAGHADLFETPEGEWWAVFLAQRPGPGKFQALGRETFMMPVKWSQDGFPYMTQATDTVPMVLERKVARRGDKMISGNFVWADDFSSPKLRPEWMSLRGDASHYYTLGKDGLRLAYGEELSTGSGTPAYLGRRLQHHKFDVETALVFDKAPSAGESAGLMILKTEDRQYYLAVGDKAVELRQIGRKGAVDVLASEPVDFSKGRDYVLKVVSDGEHYDFMWRQGDRGEWHKLASGIDASYVSCDRTGGFTGATVGVYAERR